MRRIIALFLIFSFCFLVVYGLVPQVKVAVDGFASSTLGPVWDALVVWKNGIVATDWWYYWVQPNVLYIGFGLGFGFVLIIQRLLRSPRIPSWLRSQPKQQTYVPMGAPTTPQVTTYQNPNAPPPSQQQPPPQQPQQQEQENK